MTKHIIQGSNAAASVPSLSDIGLNITNVKGAIEAALETVEHNDSQAAGTLNLALAEINGYRSSWTASSAPRGK